MKRHLHLVIAIIAAACVDPQQTQDEADIPDDGRPDGPDHHVGYSCTACHNPNGSGSPNFSVAGSIFLEGSTSADGIPDVKVIITEGNGVEHAPLVTNAVGNFYVDVDEWAPVYPLRVRIESADGTRKQVMNTLIGRDAGCGRCHDKGIGGRTKMARITLPAEPTSDAGTDAGDAGTDGGN